MHKNFNEYSAFYSILNLREFYLPIPRKVVVHIDDSTEKEKGYRSWFILNIWQYIYNHWLFNSSDYLDNGKPQTQMILE